MVTRLFIVLVMLALLAPPNVAVAASMPSCRSGDPVVWVNSNSHVYHLKGDKYYGNTKAGDYECQSKAVAGGSHASGSSKTASSKGTSSKSASSMKRTPASIATSAAAVAPDTTTVTSPAPMKKKKKHSKTAATPAP